MAAYKYKGYALCVEFNNKDRYNKNYTLFCDCFSIIIKIYLVKKNNNLYNRYTSKGRKCISCSCSFL